VRESRPSTVSSEGNEDRIGILVTASGIYEESALEEETQARRTLSALEEQIAATHGELEKAHFQG